MSLSAGSYRPRGPFSGAAPLALRPLSAIAASTGGGVPQARIKRLLSEVLPSLMRLHAQGEICGAISLDTVGMDENARAHLLPELTPPRVGLVPGFAPFEQYTDLAQWPRGAWTDVYALCALMYVLVIGLRPPSAPERLVSDHYEPLTSLGLSKYRPDFLSVIDQGLAMSPAQRPQTLDELAAMLDISVHAEVTSVTQDSQESQEIFQAAASAVAATVADKPRSAGRPLLVLLLVLVLISAGVYAWLCSDTGVAHSLITRFEGGQPNPSAVIPVVASVSANLFAGQPIHPSPP